VSIRAVVHSSTADSLCRLESLLQFPTFFLRHDNRLLCVSRSGDVNTGVSPVIGLERQAQPGLFCSPVFFASLSDYS
jgi:hypothetical protein